MLFGKKRKVKIESIAKKIKNLNKDKKTTLFDFYLIDKILKKEIMRYVDNRSGE